MAGIVVEDRTARRDSLGTAVKRYHREGVCEWEQRASLGPTKGAVMPGEYVGNATALCTSRVEVFDKQTGKCRVILEFEYLEVYT
jgi:hypothetical protein